jgi:mannosyl-3-phosphoglycerate phosphatase
LLCGFDEFAAGLERAGIPAVWVSSCTRLQLDEPRRKFGHVHPFIAEGGCGVFLPQDYFHLRPGAAGSKNAKGTVRLGRFTCLPIAEQQPAAAEALEALASELSVGAVSLASLSPRELAQNLGVQPREAELARQRDFDEPFFFAGAGAVDIKRFQELARAKGCQLRQHGSLWSLAVGASIGRCVRELSKLYDRALHAHSRSIAMVVGDCADELVSACNRAIRFTGEENSLGGVRGRRVMELPNRAVGKWEQVLEAIETQR